MRRYHRNIVNPGFSRRLRRLQFSRQRFALRIDLMGMRPPLWRRIETNSELTLDTMHVVKQAAFEWHDSHLHEFSKVSPLDHSIVERYLMPYTFFEPNRGDRMHAGIGRTGTEWGTSGHIARVN